MKTKLIFCSILMLYLQLVLYAREATIQGVQSEQQRKITGKVSSHDDSEDLPGVNVYIKGTTQGTVTDAEGMYSIEVPDEDVVLIFSSIGYVTEEIVVGGRSVIDINMVPDITALEEIVVVGYGTQKKSDLTGSVASVGENDIKNAQSLTFDLALQGKVAGVQVVSTSAEPGGGVNVTIRGANSLSGSNEPLYVIDGIPVPSIGQANNSSGIATVNPLDFMNINDIKSIEILKDATSTAIYGSRGANGVILITTKTKESGKSRIDINVSQTISVLHNKLSMMDGSRFATLRNEEEWYAWDGDVLNLPEYSYDGSSIWYPTPDSVGTSSRDWIDEMTQFGQKQDVQISYSGMVNKSSFRVSGNYLDEKGIIRNTGYKRFNLRTNLTTDLTSQLTSIINLNFSSSKSDRAQSGPTGGLLDAIWTRPIFPREYDYVTDDVFTSPEETGAQYVNPVRSMIDKLDEAKNDSYSVDLTLNYKLAKNFLWVNRTSFRKKYSKVDQFWPLSTRRGYNNNGVAVKNSFNSWSLVYESFFNYASTIINKDHDLNATLGTAIEEGASERFDFTVTNFDLQGLGIDAIQMGSESASWNTSKIEPNGLYSLYLRSQYSYKQKYLVNFTSRVDGSRKFSKNKKWAFFPSVGLAWRVDQESFMYDVEFIDHLKLRFSSGSVGSQAIRPYNSLSTYGTSNYNFNDELTLGIAPEILGNNDLHWEVTRQLNAGVDIGILEGRINVTADLYKKNTSGLLNSLSLAPSSGFTSQLTNIGEIQNMGYELMVDALILDESNYSWRSSFNFSQNVSEIVDLGEKSEIYGPDIGGSTALNVPAHVFKAGEPYGTFYGWENIGLLQSADFDSEGKALVPIYPGSKEGMYKYKDQDGNGTIDDKDRVVIGNSNPAFIFGWSNAITLGDFELSALFQGSVGYDILNIGATYYRSGKRIHNQTVEYYQNRYVPEHKAEIENPFSEVNIHNDARYPIFGTNYQLIGPSSAFIEDGSYVRLRELALRYKISIKNVRSFQLVLSCQNLLTITNYSGFDPEVSSFGNDNMRPGVDYGGYPRPRTFTVGLQLGL